MTEGQPAPRILGGKYELVQPLRRGGMGSVWYARHLVLDSPVAVKLLEPGLDRARFLLEARTAAALRSPHVVQIIDYGVEGDTPYIVMELLEGESLAERLTRVRRLDPAETDSVIVQIARAVGRAHELDVIHRDLKPANVFIVKNEDTELVKLLDFGIVKAPSSHDRSTTKSGTFLGTPLYASPEQTQGEHIDHRADVWSLGVIAFECLTGARPFGGETFGAIVLAICTKPLPRPSSVAPVPAGFDDWFARACARERGERFDSARRAAEALSQLVRGKVSSAPLPTHDVPTGHALDSTALMGPAITRPEPDTNASGLSQASLTLAARTIAPRRSRLRALAVVAGLVLLVLVVLRLSSHEPDVNSTAPATPVVAAPTLAVSASALEPAPSATASVAEPPKAEPAASATAAKPGEPAAKPRPRRKREPLSEPAAKPANDKIDLGL